MSADDPKLGTIAVARGWISQAQLEECLALQKSRTGGGRASGRLLGEILLEKGYLTPERLQWLILHQERYIVACPHCGARLLAPELPPGTKTHCTRCKGEIVLCGPGKVPLKVSAASAVDAPPAGAAAPAEEPDPLVGREIAGYRIEGRLGAGGMGVVYRARQIALDRPVALKFMKADAATSRDFIERFKREAQAAARLNHPNIVQVHDAGHDGDALFFSMECVEGETLADLLDRQGKIPPAKALRVVREVTRALAYAHTHGVVHRDIKPDNIMITRDGRVKLADLGLAKVTDHAASDVSLTLSGAVMGTPYYMSPEQTRDTRTVDGRSDIYSLGATFYRAVTGMPPFDGESPIEVMVKIQKGPPPLAHEVNPEIPWIYGQLIARMMATNPADRFGSAADLLKSIEAIERGSTTVRPVEAADTPPARTRQPAGAAAALAAGAALFAGGFWGGGAFARRDAPPSPPPVRAAQKPPAAAQSPLPTANVPPAAEETPATAIDPAAVGWSLFETLRRDRPGDADAHAALLDAILAAADENTLSPYLSRAREAREAVRGHRDRLRQEKAVMAVLAADVDALCGARDYEKALDVKRLARQYPKEAGLPAFADFLAALPARVETAARADWAAAAHAALARAAETNDLREAAPILAEAAPRYAPFPDLHREASTLAAALAALPPRETPTPAETPLEEPEGEPPPTEETTNTKKEKAPPRAKPRKRPQQKTYFQNTSQLKEWFYDPMVAEKPRVQEGGVVFRSFHGEIPFFPPGPPEEGGFHGGGAGGFSFGWRQALRGPDRIEFLWIPRAKDSSRLSLFLRENAVFAEKPKPALYARADKNGLKVLSPFFETENEGAKAIDLDHSPEGYRVTIAFLPDEERARLTVARASRKKGAQTRDMTFPFPTDGEIQLMFLLAPDDLLGPVTLSAEGFVPADLPR